MKDLFQCKECGFLSTYYPGFIKVNGELLCEYCARENHSVIRSNNLKSSNNKYTASQATPKFCPRCPYQMAPSGDGYVCTKCGYCE